MMVYSEVMVNLLVMHLEINDSYQLLHRLLGITGRYRTKEMKDPTYKRQWDSYPGRLETMFLSFQINC